MAYDGMIAEEVWVEGHNGDAINAYLARPLGAGPFGAVMLFHHMPGWDDATKRSATSPSPRTCTTARAATIPTPTAPASATRAGCPMSAHWGMLKARLGICVI